MRHRIILLVVVAVVLTGCGSTTTTTTTTAATTATTTTAARSPATTTASTGDPALAAAMVDVNHLVDRFTAATKTNDRASIAAAASAVATKLANVAATHPGPLGNRLTAASRSWQQLAATALHGTDQDAANAERAVEARMRAVESYTGASP